MMIVPFHASCRFSTLQFGWECITYPFIVGCLALSILLEKKVLANRLTAACQGPITVHRATVSGIELRRYNHAF